MKQTLTNFYYELKADLYNLIEKKQTANPIQKLNQYIKEAEAQVKSTAKLVERQGQVKLALEKELEEATAMLAKRQDQLQLATAANELDLITFATQEVEAYKERAQTLQSSIEEAMKAYFELEQKYEVMKHKIKDMKVRQLELMSKENVTRAHKQMDQVIATNEQTASSVNSIHDYIDQLSTKVEREYEMTTYEARLAALQKEQAPVISK